MKKKLLLRAVVLFLIMIGLIAVLNSVFQYETSQMSARYTTYFSLPENTVDVLLVGTSGIDRYWIAAKGYEEYGITAYPVSFASMPAWLMVNIISAALTVQNPELVVIDMRPFTESYGEQLRKYETPIHRVIDIMDSFTPNWFNAVSKSVKIIGKNVGWSEFSPISFYLPFIKYHSRWEDQKFSIDEMVGKPSEYLGMYLVERDSIRQVMLPVTERISEHIALDPICEDALYELLDYLEGLKCEVLFLDTPKFLNMTQYGRMNTLRSILDERDYNYKCYDAEDGTYNLHTDFYNKTHVNYQGAEKFTEVFAAYLKENYQIMDRRDDEGCAEDWDGVYEKVLERYNSFLKNNMIESMEIETEEEDRASEIS